MYDIVGEAQIIGAAGADPDMRALMSGNPALIGAQFAGRVPAMRAAMATLAQLSQRMQSIPAGPLAGLMGQQRVLDARLEQAVSSNTPIAVDERIPTQAYEVPFGFVSLAVPAANNIVLQLTPAATFKPNRLSIPQAVAPSFVMTAFTIGQTSLILNGNQVPCEAFSDQAYNPRGWKLPTIQVGQPASIAFTNISGAAADLRGNFWGVFIT